MIDEAVLSKLRARAKALYPGENGYYRNNYKDLVSRVIKGALAERLIEQSESDEYFRKLCAHAGSAKKPTAQKIPATAAVRRGKRPSRLDIQIPFSSLGEEILGSHQSDFADPAWISFVEVGESIH